MIIKLDTKQALLLMSLLILAVPVTSKNYDFSINFYNCKTVINSLNRKSETIRIEKSKSYHMNCIRNQDKYICDIYFDDGTTTQETLEIVLESLKLVIMESASNLVFVSINMKSKVAGSIFRKLDPEYIEEKICNGSYL